MTKSEKERLVQAIKKAAAHGNVVDRLVAIEAAVVALVDDK